MNLIDYADPFEAQCLEAYELHGSSRAAGEALNVHRSTVLRAIERVKNRAAVQGFSPDHAMTHTVPDTFVAKRISTLYGSEGEVKQQWVIGVLDAEKRQAAMIAATAAMCESILPQAPITAPKLTSENLCNLYTYTDYHLGMLAWHREGGADWDLKIAENLLLNSFLGMLALSPNAEACVLNIQGDFLHSDGLMPVTPAHGHILDTDGRFSKIVSSAIRVLRKLCNTALAKHKTVHVVIAEGNHDESSAVWLRQMFAALFDEEPRLTVNDSELPFYVYQWGSTMLAFHHGHKMKNEQMPMLFAAQFPIMWGATTKRYCNTGHRHHVDEKEYSGMIVTQHPTLSARDAYASRGGWMGERAANSSTFHTKFGRVFNNTVCPEMFEEAA
jgi:hypothetical protein